MDKQFTKSLSVNVNEQKDGEIEAYITTFNTVDKAGDIFLPEAFDEFLKSFDPETKKLPMLWEHDVRDLVGEWVELTKDAHGIKAKGIIYTDTTKGRDIWALLKRKAVEGVSIGFTSDAWKFNDQGGITFSRAKLVETSIALRGVNDLAVVTSVKSADGLIETVKLKSLLKEGGLSRKEIEALFNDGWKGLKSLRVAEKQNESFLETLKAFKF